MSAYLNYIEQDSESLNEGLKEQYLVLKNKLADIQKNIRIEEREEYGDEHSDSYEDEYSYMEYELILEEIKSIPFSIIFYIYLFVLILDEIKVYQYESDINKLNRKVNNHGETYLHEAARNGETEKVKELIAKKYDVNARDYGGWTPLSEAVSANRYDIVNILINNGANVNTKSSECTFDGEDNAVGFAFFVVD